MKFGLLSATHADYDAETWADYDALYEGGKKFRQRINRFLCQNPQEPPEVFERRKKQARYRSYVGPICDTFASQLMAAPMTIRKTDLVGESVEADPFYSLLESDFDGQGTDIVEFCRSTFQSALVKQRAWWLAVMPSNDGAPPETRAEWEERKLGRVRVVKLEAESVLDWEFAEDGSLLWAIVYQCTTKRASIGESRTKLRHTWRVYDATNVITYELEHDPKKDKPITEDTEVPEIGPTPHGFPRVPLTQFCLPKGLWLVNRVADSQTEHFDLSAARSWAIKRSCYAMPVFITDSENPTVMGTGYFVRMNPGEDIKWTAPPSQPFEVIGEAIKSEKDEIYRVVGQMAQGVENNAAAVGRSGESKLADTNATEVCLKAYGGEMREHIERAFDLIVAGRRDENLRINVEGLERFNLSDGALVVESAVEVKEVGIRSATFQKELEIKVAEALLPGLEQAKKDAMRAEIEAGVDAKMAEAEKLRQQPPPDAAPGTPVPPTQAREAA